VNVDLHRIGELRSRAYHRAIAGRLVDDPSIVTRARTQVDTWEQAGSLHPNLAALWRDVLALPAQRLVERLVEDSEQMTLLRSSSPFAGELAPRERWQIWEAVRREAES
jgi:hypothetical protein